MRYLYYCNSTYQFISILNMHLGRTRGNFEQIDNYEADIVILDSFYDAKKIIKYIHSELDFKKVFVIHKVKNDNSLHSFISLFNILYPIHYLKTRGLDPNKISRNEYDYIVSPTFTKTAAAFWQLNKKAKLHLFDEGLGSYFDEIELKSNSKSYKLFKYFNFGRTFNDCERLYLNQLSLYRKKSNKIRKIAKQEDILDKIKSIYDVESKIIDANILWIDQVLGIKNFDLIKNILTKYKDKILYVPHPREYENKDTNLFRKSTDKFAFEFGISKYNNINNLCILTIHSTAAFTPKLLFDYEPYVIFVHNIVDIPNKDLTQQTIDKFKKIYNDKSKINCPRTIEELDKCLKDFIDNSNKKEEK